MKRDLHVHSVYSDGKNTPEEIVAAAIALGLEEIAVTDHSYTWFDESYCIKKDAQNAYIDEISALKARYSDKIRILCGIEQDYYSEEPTDRFDFVVGSVHYIKCGEQFVEVDHLSEARECIAGYFGGDSDAYAEKYFSTLSDVCRRTGCDIIGHFDLITKFCERETLFDTESPRYIAAWKGAVDELLKYGKPFEINTGAISRGYRTSPYPSMAQIDYIKSHGGRLVLSSDAHSILNLCSEFEKYSHLTE